MWLSGEKSGLKPTMTTKDAAVWTKKPSLQSMCWLSSSTCTADLQAAGGEPGSGTLLLPTAGWLQPDGPSPLPPRPSEPDHLAVHGVGWQAQGQPGAQGAPAGLRRALLSVGQRDSIQCTARGRRILHVGAKLWNMQQRRAHLSPEGVLAGWTDRYESAFRVKSELSDTFMQVSVFSVQGGRASALAATLHCSWPSLQQPGFSCCHSAGW